MGTEVRELSTVVDNSPSTAVQGWGMDQVWEQVLESIEERIGRTATRPGSSRCVLSRSATRPSPRGAQHALSRQAAEQFDRAS